jgi:hypothetical protein
MNAKQTKQVITNEMIWNLLQEINHRLAAIEKHDHSEGIDTKSSLIENELLDDEDIDNDDDPDRYHGYANDTEYLKSNPKNWARLVAAAKQVNEGKDLISVPIEQFLR